MNIPKAYRSSWMKLLHSFEQSLDLLDIILKSLALVCKKLVNLSLLFRSRFNIYFFDLELVLGPGCIFEGDHITRPYGGGQ